MGHFSHMTELITKHFTLQEFKAADNEGNFRGILSTYGNEDLAGDICDQGCWTDSVSAKGGQFPLLWQHDMTEPIGSFKVVDTTAALVIEGHFNQDVQRGREAYALLKAGDVKGLSVGFNMLDWAYIDGVRHITKADLWEGSFVTFPCNTLAYAEAKAMALKNGVAIRKSLSALPEFKSLTEEQQEKILRAIDEAVSEEPAPEDEENKGEEPKDTETEDESKDDEPEDKESEDDPEDDSEVQKAMESLRELKSSMQDLAQKIKDVQI